MIFKHYRQIRFLKVTLTWNKDISGDIVLPSLKDILSKIHEKFDSNQIFLKKYYNDRISMSLRDMKYDDSSKTMSLLVGSGNKEAADPAFLDDNGLGTRVEKARENESLGVATHINFCLTPYNNNFYVLTRDFVSGIGNIQLCRFLNYILAKHITYEIEIEGVIYKIKPRIVIEELASKTLQEALRDKQPIGIEVSYTSCNSQSYDENFSIKKKIKKGFISFPREWDGDTFLRKLVNFVPSLRGEYTDITVKCSKGKDNYSYNLSIDELNNNYLSTYLFADKESIQLNSPIGQLQTAIHQELDNKMKRYTLAKHRELAR